VSDAMNVEDVPVIVDGPNYVNRVLDLRIDHDLVAGQLTLTGLRRAMNDGIRYQQLAPVACNTTIDFICSKKLFGPPSNKITQLERELLLGRLMRETGVHIEEIDLPGDSEKGVDGAVQSRLEELAKDHQWVVLVSADRDYVPVLRKLRKGRTRVLLASLQSDFPRELANEAWGIVELHPFEAALFAYSYPTFDIEGFTQDECRNLIANADDRQNNQIRITEDGRVFASTGDAIGNRQRDGIRFSLETFAAGNDYCGPRAASDKRHVEPMFDDIGRAWRRGQRGHIGSG
jgi:hypothetical protein